MPDPYINDLEEQLRQDRRLGNARRRKRRIRKLLPLLALLPLAVGLFFLLRGSGDETPTQTETVAPGSSVATLSFVGDISLDDAMLQRVRSESGYDFTSLLLFRSSGYSAVYGDASIIQQRRSRGVLCFSKKAILDFAVRRRAEWPAAKA